jgi:hypothetical protein
VRFLTEFGGGVDNFRVFPMGERIGDYRLFSGF